MQPDLPLSVGAVPLQVQASKDSQRCDGFKSVVDWVWLCSIISSGSRKLENKRLDPFRVHHFVGLVACDLELPGSCMFTMSFVPFC